MPDKVDTEAVRIYWERSKDEIQREVISQHPGTGPGGGLTQVQTAAAQKRKRELWNAMPAHLKEALRREARENLQIPEETASMEEPLPLLRRKALQKALSLPEGIVVSRIAPAAVPLWKKNLINLIELYVLESSYLGMGTPRARRPHVEPT